MRVRVRVRVRLGFSVNVGGLAEFLVVGRVGWDCW